MTDNIIYTSRAICISHKITLDTLSEMVRYGIANPRGNRIEKWYFSSLDYRRIELASKYYHSLKLDPKAAVVALKLRDDIACIKHNEVN